MQLIRGLLGGAGKSLSRSALASMTIYFVGAASVIVMETSLARILGVDAFGIFITTYNLVLLCAIVGKLGLDLTAIRLLTAYRVNEEWSLFRGLLQRARLWVSATSLALAAVLAAIAIVAYRDRNPLFRDALVLGAVTLPLLAMAGVRQGVLFSLNRPVLALFPERVMLPLGLALTVCVFASLRDTPPDSTDALALTAVVALAVLALSAVWMRANVPLPARDVPARQRDREWLGLSLPLAGLSIAQNVLGKSDIVLVGILRSPAEAALYAAATTLATLTVFFLTSANKVISVRFSELHAGGDQRGLQGVLTSTTCIFTLMTLPVLAALVLAGPQLLALYGESFRVAYPILLLLLVGRAITVFCGSVGFMLAMTGHERLASKIVIAVSLGSVALNLAVIPAFGIVGAAIVTTSMMTLRSVLLAFFVWRKVGLVPTCAAPLLQRAGGTV